MYQSQAMEPYASGSAKIVAHASLRPGMGPAYGASPGPATAAPTMAAPSTSLPPPGTGYNLPPISRNESEPLTLHGIDLENLLRDCGFVKPSTNHPVPVTVLDMTRPPGQNFLPLTVNPGRRSMSARDVPVTSGGYGNMAGMCGGGMMPQQARDGVSSFGAHGTMRFGSGGMSQYRGGANTMPNSYGVSNLHDSGAASPSRRDMSPVSFGGAYNTAPRNFGRYSLPAATRAPQVGPTDYRTYPSYGPGMTPVMAGGARSYHTQYGGRPHPADAGMAGWPRQDARSRRSISPVTSPVPRGPTVGGVTRRSFMVPTATDRVMQASIVRRGPSPPPGRSPSPVPDGGGMMRMNGRSPSPAPRRSVVAARGRGVSPAVRPSHREQVMAREALSEAHDMLSTVRREIDNRDDIRQKLRPHDLERFKAAVFQLERALETQTEPYRRCRSPPPQQ
ncbi:uncharacterized protein LOC144105603 [Amblyomma americanum]